MLSGKPRISSVHIKSQTIFSKNYRRSFKILPDAQKGNHTLPQFMVNSETGFLPREEPLFTLPSKFQKLDEILEAMPLKTNSGEEGLLAKGVLGKTVDDTLPLIDTENINDSRVLHALFRDYTFLASAYLLEPCDISYRKTRSYGLARDYLPKQIAVPLLSISRQMNTKPFMEYALSYALYNYKRIDQNNPNLDYDNLGLIRAFENSYSERGFIITHVTMVKYTGEFIAGLDSALQAIQKFQDKHEQQSQQVVQGMQQMLTAMQKINKEMDTMWKKSIPTDYDNFRTFIMGIKNQPMFPRGVKYIVGDNGEGEYQAYRGESGANDSIIPSLDNFLQVTQELPNNSLTDILKDFRSYRPSNHNEFLTFLEGEAKRLNIKEKCLNNEFGVDGIILYIRLLDQIREFRERHWRFTLEYIIKHSQHKVATGGSPIATYLPNQLATVLTMILSTCKRLKSSIFLTQFTAEQKKIFDDIENISNFQLTSLIEQREKLAALSKAEYSS